MLNCKWIAAGFGTALLTATPALAAQAMPAYVTAAVNDSARPDTDKQLDPARKPAEMLIFAGIKPGMRVMDLMPGGGYFTRVFAEAVGPKGYVYPYEVTQYDALYKGNPAPIFAVAAAYRNVSVIHAAINNIVAPEPLDVVWTSQNYHDMHNSFMGPADMALVDKAVFDALKPGGVFIVLDHAAEPGSGLRDTNTLHRIDEEAVKKEVEAAGFKLVGESKVLRNASDMHTLKIFDPSIRRKTDQFILKFRKPAK